MKPSLLLAFALPAGLLSQETPAPTNLTTESFTCQNGSAGSLVILESSVGLIFSGSLGRVESCDSTTTYQVVQMGACSLAIIDTEAPATAPGFITTPSTTTPAIYSYDAGPALFLRGPNDREIRIERQISGPSTSYSFQEFRLPDFSNPLAPAAPNQFIRDGRFTLRGEGGRDVPAFERGFDLRIPRITKPLNLSTASGQNPPTLDWTAGDSMTEPVQIQATVSGTSGATPGARSRRYSITCRVPNGRAGTFTFPAATWNAIPAEVRTGGLAGLALFPTGPTAVLDVPELEKGLRIDVQQSATVTLVLTP